LHHLRIVFGVHAIGPRMSADGGANQIPVTARPGCRVGTAPARRDKGLLSVMYRPLVMS